MTNEEYVQAALRTESLSDEVRVRFGDQEIMDALVDHMSVLVDSLETLDMLKKYMFYGKWREELRGLFKASLPCGVYDYKETAPPNYVIRMFHAVVGMATETGELMKALVVWTHTADDLDRVNLIEEVGDVFWYQAIAADALNTTFEEIQERNIAKLKARYPGKFTNEKAVERDLAEERRVLEAKGEGRPL